MRRPSDRVIVQASVVARLLGIRLLELDARVFVDPAERPAPLSRRPAAHSIGAGLDDAERVIEAGAANRASSRRRAPREASRGRLNASLPRSP